MYFQKLVQGILEKNPGGETIFKEYRKTKCLTDSTRRKMITILVADMREAWVTVVVKPIEKNNKPSVCER